MTIPNTNIPREEINDTDRAVREFFDTFYETGVEYSANDVDAVTGFFTKRGFDDRAAISIASVLLRQAKIDNVKTFKLIDTLEGLTDVQLSSLVAQVLNVSRVKTSKLGYRTKQTTTFESRNIVI